MLKFTEISWDTYGRVCMWNLGFKEFRETPRRLHGWLTSNPFRQKLRQKPHAKFTQAWLQKLNSDSTLVNERCFLYRDRKRRKLMQVFSFSKFSNTRLLSAVRCWDIFFLSVCFHMRESLSCCCNKDVERKFHCPSRCQLRRVFPGVAVAFGKL